MEDYLRLLKLNMDEFITLIENPPKGCEKYDKLVLVMNLIDEFIVMSECIAIAQEECVQLEAKERIDLCKK